LNASDDRKIAVVREEIKDFAGTRQIFDKGIKLVILDEADAMTNDAQAALRRVIEQYTKNTRFCLICNQVNKIAPAIQSRCTKFRFGPLEDKDIESRLLEIIKAEKVNATPDGIKALIRLARGDMRKVLNVLQATHMACSVVNEENVYSCTGNPLPKDIQNVLQWMLNEDFTQAFNKVRTIQTDKGLALQDIIRDIHVYLSHMELHDDVLIDLYSKLADIEYRLSKGASDKVQLGAVVGAFQVARNAITGEDQ